MELKDYYLAVKAFSKATKITEDAIEAFVKEQVKQSEEKELEAIEQLETTTPNKTKTKAKSKKKKLLKWK